MRVGEPESLVIAAVFGGLVGGLALATAWNFNPDKDFWDILTAIGTVSSAVVAVGIALRDAAWRRQTQESEALIAWAMLAPEVVQVRDALSEVSEYFHGPIIFPGMVMTTEARQFPDRLNLTFAPGLIDKLAFLPDGRGTRIAAAMGLLPAIKERIAVLGSGVARQNTRAIVGDIRALADAAVAHFDYAIDPAKR